MTTANHFDILGMARRYKAGGPTKKATLMILMEHMGLHDGEWTCWPSVASLAGQTEQGERTVRRHVAEFEESGLVTRRARGRTGGGRDANEYVLDLAFLAKQSGQSGQFDEAKRPTDVGQSGQSQQVIPHIEQLENFDVPPAGENHPPPPEKPNGSGARGSRLPEPFMLTKEMRAWASEHVIGVDVHTQTEQFCDHYRAKSGSDAVKRDWVAAWRNWMRKAESYADERRVRHKDNGHQQLRAPIAAEDAKPWQR